MYKTKLKVTDGKIEIVLPNEYLNDEVEVFVYRKKDKPSDLSNFFGVTEIENIDESIGSIRDEWER